MSGSQLQALEAVVSVAAKYGLPREQLKPCVAFLLDGNITGDRHECAYIIAIECRRMGVSVSDAERVVRRWARKIEYREHDAARALRSAYAKLPSGEWRYHAPGLTKRPGTVAQRILTPTCVDVGCPANCTPFRELRVGNRGETFARFNALGWSVELRRRRCHGALAVYRALCELERERNFAPGSKLFVSYAQLARATELSKQGMKRRLEQLAESRLIAFVPGDGAGPNAHDRKATEVSRTMPIPCLAREGIGLLIPQSKNGSSDATQYGSSDATTGSPTPAPYMGQAPDRNGRVS